MDFLIRHVLILQRTIKTLKQMLSLKITINSQLMPPFTKCPFSRILKIQTKFIVSTLDLTLSAATAPDSTELLSDSVSELLWRVIVVFALH